MDDLRLTAYHRVYIVGAQSRAKTLTGYLHLVYPHIQVAAYLVDQLSGNASDIDGVPVLELSSGTGLDIEFPVFIATKGIFHAQIQKTLEVIGFQTVIPITPELDNRLRNVYVEAYFDQRGYPFKKITEYSRIIKADGSVTKVSNRTCDVGHRNSVCVYMARSVYDKPLQSDYRSPVYERAIQVGAALTEERLEEGILTDHAGENISFKNRQYCELTGLYWIWKHAKEDIIGLSHYRRHFILPEDWQEVIKEQEIDVILPVPACVLPSVEENYRERHEPSDWEYLLEYLREKLPQDYEAAKVVFCGSLYSPCNMFIMWREILDDLCSWLFPILDAVAKHGGEKEDVYQNRYVGFVSERLMTLYFYKNRDRYKIVFADKSFIN